MQLAFVPPAASPIRRQYLTLKRQHPDAILFFQLGDFYETFEEDARLVAEVCDIALTSREMGKGERVPMAGVPIHAAEVYLGRLVERGYHIAICQQMEEPSAAARVGSTVVRREVTRVITPGTLVDPSLLSAERANYLAALVVEGKATGLAYADISTGEFACVEMQGGSHAEAARAELWRLRPAECLVEAEMAGQGVLPEGCSATVDESLFSRAEAERTLCQHFGVASSAALGLAERPLAARAVAAVLQYLGRTQPRAAASVERLRVYEADGHMALDPATREHLELTRGARGRRDGSLLHALDRTRTPMGARTLVSWLSHPLVDKPGIDARLDGVGWLVDRAQMRPELRAALGELPDLARLAGRAAQRLLTPREALALAAGLERATHLRELLPLDVPGRLGEATGAVDPPLEIVDDIRSTLVDDPPLIFGEGVIRRGRISELDDLRVHSTDGRRWLLDLERRERERSGVKNLKVGYNRVFGYYLEVSVAALGQSLDYYRRQETEATTVAQLLEQLGYQRRQTLTSVERFATGELREHEAKQARATARMAELERAAFDALLDRVAREAARLRSTADAVAEIDVLASFAQIAEEQRYVCPDIVEEARTEIVGGRHPVVEGAIGWDAYIPNDVHLGVGGWGLGDGKPVEPEDDPLSGAPLSRQADSESTQVGPPASNPQPPTPQVILLTGPNMAGKTTYGRMVLLVALLGQCGCFVPAERARLGLVDRIFLRSGAGDDIAGGQSTFMVEMTETAAILRNATSRSLAFFDEVGRGTSTYDGMAIARAIVERLASPERGCRTIFSTHYHELADIADELPAVCNFHMDVQESARQVWFTYRVAPGSADRSYGVHVARLAGLPSAVVARADVFLRELEDGAGSGQSLERPATKVVPPLPEVVYDLADVDVERTTPLEALQALERLRARAADLLSGDS